MDKSTIRLRKEKYITRKLFERVSVQQSLVEKHALFSQTVRGFAYSDVFGPRSQLDLDSLSVPLLFKYLIRHIPSCSLQDSL